LFKQFLDSFSTHYHFSSSTFFFFLELREPLCESFFESDRFRGRRRRSFDGFL
jgi:hypothetical protein